MTEDKKYNWYSSLLNYSAIIIVTAIIYFVSARLSLFLAVSNTNATSVWPPSGIAFAIILLFGYRMGPAVLLGAFLANYFALQSLNIELIYNISASTTIAIGNMMEGIVGVYLFKRFSEGEHPFNTIKDLSLFVLFGSLISTMISATVGVNSYCFATKDWSSFMQIWLTWWLGDAAGVLIVSPIIILLAKKLIIPIRGKKLLEATLLFFIILFSSILIFWNNYHLEYIIIIPLLWIAFRFGRLYSAISVFIVSIFAIVCTINQIGLHADQMSYVSLRYLQTYIGVISIITLSLSIITYERSVIDKSRMASQKQLYDIIDFLPDAMIAIDKDGKVIAWNKAIETLSGVSKKDIMGKGNYEYSDAFYGERKQMLIDLALNTDKPVQLENYEFMEKKGSTLFSEKYNKMRGIYLSCAASALTDSEGNIYGAIESMRDISDRKKAESELQHYKEHLEDIVKERSISLTKANEELIKRMRERDRVEKALFESERKYRDLVESANSAILRWKPDGLVTFINSYGLEFFGFNKSEMIGKSIMETIVPTYDSSGRELSLLISEVARNPEGHTFNENENITKAGKKVWIAWTNKPIYNQNGALEEILSVGNDITERKKIEESLRKTLSELAQAKEHAEAADRIKSAFLATMSHELRTPLNSIIGFTGVILQGLAGPINDEQKKQLGMVRGSAQHLLSLINDVLDISKIEAGQLEVQFEPFDIKSSIDKVTSTVKPLVDKKCLALNISIGKDLNSLVNDQRRVEQVLLNLLSNAIKFTEQGTVTLNVEKVTQYIPDEMNQKSRSIPAIQFEVIDTGIGIRPEDLNVLFQPFRQIDSGITRKSEGTGLGLAICRKLAELMGGTITAKSEWGHGSQFTFIIPLTQSVLATTTMSMR